MSKILAVDDSQTMREMLTYTLQSANHEVFSAKNGQDALNKLPEVPVDMVITDLNMAHMGGMELLEKLRTTQSYHNTPILILTSESDEQKKQKARALGATGWVIKPFNPEKLLKVITKLV